MRNCCASGTQTEDILLVRSKGLCCIVFLFISVELNERTGREHMLVVKSGETAG